MDDATDVEEFFLEGERRIAAVGLEQRLRWRGWLEADLGLRLEGNRTLGRSLDRVALPFVAVTARPGAGDGAPLAWWPAPLHLRGAWGRGVNVPDHDGRDLDRVGLAPEAPDPTPERTTGWELGAGGVWADGDVAVEAVRYQQTTRDLLLRTPRLFSQAAEGARFDPVGAVRNRGWEGSVRLRLRRGEGTWGLDAVVGLNDNEVTELGPPPGSADPAEVIQGVQWTVEGHPLAGYWARPLRWEDRDGDGILVPSEINVDPEPRYLGTPHPRREVGLTGRFERGGVAVHARLHHRGGHRLRNLTEGYRCQVTLCRGFNDPGAPLDRQARAQAVAIFPADFFTEAGFIEDASFWRLSEAGVSWRLPASWPGGGDARLAVLGENLALWTDYSGMDPEVNQFGATEVLARDFMTQPPVRRWTVRVDVSARPW